MLISIHVKVIEQILLWFVVYTVIGRNAKFQSEVTKYKDTFFLLIQVHGLPKFYPKEFKISNLSSSVSLKTGCHSSAQIISFRTKWLYIYLIQNRSQSLYLAPRNPKSSARLPPFYLYLAHKHTCILLLW